MSDPSSPPDPDLAKLARAIEAVESAAPGDEPVVAVPTDWSAIDHCLGGGLVRSALHEWIGHAGRPLCLLSHLARCAWQQRQGYLVWIGRSCWPHPWSLADVPERLDDCLWVNPADPAARDAAGELALRSKCVTAVILDGTGTDLAATRRMQLAAEAGRALALVARPAGPDTASSCVTRWTVSPAPNDDYRPSWQVQLTRCRGRQLAAGGSLNSPGADPTPWSLTWNPDAGTVDFSARLADRPGQAATSTRRQSA
ncbi:MAG: hypothetical protein R3336_04260 [Phycisphaeraceae bacterium]|nr:hypothetical protein [Phycisphaeraceae bacterium]